MSAAKIRAGRAYLELSLKRSKFLSGLRSTEKNFVGSLQRMSKSVAGFGAKLLGGGIGGLGSFVLPVQQFASFERALDEVYSITGEGGKIFEELEAKAKSLGATTVFSSTEAANAMTVFARAGLKTNQIISAIGPTLNTAAVGKLELAEAANIVRGVIQGMGKDFSEAENVIDVLTQASVTASTDLRGLGDAFRYVGPLARLGGETIEEVAAATMSLADANITGEMAGTTVRGSILALLSPSKEAVKELNRLKVETKDVNGDFVGFINVIGQLESKLNGFGSADKLESLGKIFQQRQASGVAQLINDGAGSLQANADALGVKGISKELADLQLDNVFGDFTRFTSVLKNVGIAIGSAFAAPLRQLFSVVNKGLGSLEAFINANKDLVAAVFAAFVVISSAGAALVALGVSSGIVLFAFSSLISVVGSMVGIFLNVVVAGGALRALLTRLATSIGGNLLKSVVSLTGPTRALMGILARFGSGVISTVSSGVIRMSLAIGNSLAGALTKAMTLLRSFGSTIYSLVGNRGLLAAASGLFIFNGGLNAVKTVVDGAVRGFLNLLGSLVKTNGVFSELIKLSSSLYEGLSALVGINMSSIGNIFSALIGQAVLMTKVVENALGLMTGFVLKQLQVVTSLGVSQFLMLSKAIIAAFSATEVGALIVNTFSAIWSTIVGASTAAISSISSAFTSIGSGISSAFSSALSFVSSVFSGIVEASSTAVQFISDSFASMGQFIGEVISGVPQWFSYMSEVFSAKMDDIFAVFGTTWRGIFDALSTGNLALAAQIGLDGLKLITIDTLDIIASVFGTTTEGLVDIWAGSIKQMGIAWLAFQKLVKEGQDSTADALAGAAEFLGIVPEGTADTLNEDQAISTEKFEKEQDAKLQEILQAEKDRKEGLKGAINDFRASEGRIKTGVFNAAIEREANESRPDLDRPTVVPTEFDGEKFKPDFETLNAGQEATSKLGSSESTFVGAAAAGLSKGNPMVTSLQNLEKVEEKKAQKQKIEEEKQKARWEMQLQKQEDIKISTEAMNNTINVIEQQFSIA